MKVNSGEGGGGGGLCHFHFCLDSHILKRGGGTLPFSFLPPFSIGVIRQ